MIEPRYQSRLPLLVMLLASVAGSNAVAGQRQGVRPNSSSVATEQPHAPVVFGFSTSHLTAGFADLFIEARSPSPELPIPELIYPVKPPTQPPVGDADRPGRAVGSPSTGRPGESKPAGMIVGPAMGTWVMERPLANGSKHTSKLFFVRERGGLFEGYVEWQTAETGRVIELFSATLDPTARTMQFSGWEMHVRNTNTKLTARSLLSYSMSLSPDGKKLTGISTSASGRFKTTEMAKPEPEIAAALELVNDRCRLYQQLSSACMLPGRVVFHRADQNILAQLTRSSDAHVALIAGKQLRLAQASAVAAAESERARAASIAAAQRSILSIGLGADPLDQAQRLIGPEYARVSNAMREASTAEAQFAEMRQSVREHFRAGDKGAEQGGIAPAGFVAGYKTDRVGNSVFGFVTLRNVTGKDLRHCVITTAMIVSDQKFSDFDHWKAVKDRPAYALLARQAATNPKQAAALALLSRGSAELEAAKLAFEKNDKGELVYVPEWKNGTTIQVGLAQSETIALVCGGVEVWIGCDAGTAVPDTKAVLKAIESIHLQRVKADRRRWEERASKR